MNSLNHANQYVNKNTSKINDEFRHSYHLMAPIGWLNDPNGFIYYKNQYHLFYQYHPYDSKWGPMHWGHAVSDDLLIWKNLPIALAPDQKYDASGVFSGSSYVENDRLYISYTGHLDEVPEQPERIRQVQAMAYSDDGIVFHKFDQNPIISTTQLPEHSTVQDFRDPKIFKKDLTYYMMVGSRNIDSSGQLLCYCSQDLIHWEYLSTPLKSENKIGKMWECPDIFSLDGRDIILISPQELPADGDRYNNAFSCVYMIGHMDEAMKAYTYDIVDQIDSGLDFYAPQTMIDRQGRRIMIAWMSMWGRRYIPHALGHGWAGAMTLPRELRIINNRLYQIPIQELENYRRDLVEYRSIVFDQDLRLEGINGQCIELDMTIVFTATSKFVLNVFEGEGERTCFIIEPMDHRLTLDRRESGEVITGEEAEMNVRRLQLKSLESSARLRLFLDRSSVEIFINDGEATMSCLVYPKKTSQQVSFFSEGIAEIVCIKKWDLL